MTREDNPEYFAHVCEVIKSVFMAEDKADTEHHLRERLVKKEITPDQYVEYIAEELISTTPKEEVEKAWR